ncbi:MAG: serine hydrolase [Gammaproteobacteria bacterium]|nr:serine hydrolase [Gammaproteobacteria bacterium]
MNITPKNIKAIESLVSAAVGENEPGIAVGIAQGGRMVWGGARGLANLAARTPFTTSTPFRICSISKQFACALAMREAREGRLKLDVHPSRYLPWARGLDSALTVAHLMQNKSGIRDQWVMAMIMGAKPTQPFTLDDGVKAVRHAPESMFAPGSRNLYCNINFEMVGQILETVTAKPFAELLAAHILQPLGMNNTTLGIDTSQGIPGDTRGYRFIKGKWEEEVNGIHWAASAGIVSTAEDLLRWAACLRDPKAAGLPWVADILELTAFNDGLPAGYASGINRLSGHGREVFMHGGGLRGWKSVLMHYVNEDTSIAVLMNRNNAPKGRKMVRAVANEIVAALGIPPVWRRTIKKPAPAKLPAGTAGAYISKEQGLLVLLRQGKKGAEMHSFLDWSSLHATGEAGTLATDDGHTRLTFDAAGGVTLFDKGENVCTPMQRIRKPAGTAFAPRGTFRCGPTNTTAKIASKAGKLSIAFTGPFGAGDAYALTVLDANTAYFDIARGVDEAPPGRFLLTYDPAGKSIELSATLARRVVFRR